MLFLIALLTPQVACMDRPRPAALPPLQQDIDSLEDVLGRFTDFKLAYNRVYKEEEEEARRFAVFNETLHAIRVGNALGPPVFGINHLSDRFESERPQRGFKDDGSLRFEDDPPLHNITTDATYGRSIDWELRGLVSPVKNQGLCGSCWAFGTTMALEAAYKLSTGAMQTFSVQQITSCAAPDSYGCDGGNPIGVWEYLSQTSEGVMQEVYYPYLQSLTELCLSTTCTEKCKPESAVKYGEDMEAYIGPYAVLTSWSFATPPCYGSCNRQDVDSVATVLYHAGPLTIVVNAGVWSYYDGGVLTAAQCGGCAYTSLDHVVTLVGFAEEYWRVANSWTTEWGEAGFIRLERATNLNTCGLADQVTLPVVSTQTALLRKDLNADEHRARLLVHANGAIDRVDEGEPPAECEDE